MTGQSKMSKTFEDYVDARNRMEVLVRQDGIFTGAMIVAIFVLIAHYYPLWQCSKDLNVSACEYVAVEKKGA